MIKLLVSLSIWLMLSLPSSYTYAETTDCGDDPRECFDGFEEDDTIITKDKAVKRTFSFPPIKAGFVIDVHNKDILPHVGVEVLEIDAPWGGDYSLDVGVAASRVFTSITWEFIPIVKAGPSIWVGYNIRQGGPAYGVGVTVLDF